MEKLPHSAAERTPWVRGCAVSQNCLDSGFKIRNAQASCLPAPQSADGRMLSVRTGGRLRPAEKIAEGWVGQVSVPGATWRGLACTAWRQGNGFHDPARYELIFPAPAQPGYLSLVSCRGQCGTAGRTLLPHQLFFPLYCPPKLFISKLLRHTQPEPCLNDMI